MSLNLATLATSERNKIEREKQAAFLVWQLKQHKVGPETIQQQSALLKTDEERAWFDACIQKYKQQMGVR